MAPLRIIDADDTRAVTALLARGPRRDRAFDRRVHGIVDRVRNEGDRALHRFAARTRGCALAGRRAATEHFLAKRRCVDQARKDKCAHRASAVVTGDSMPIRP